MDTTKLFEAALGILPPWRVAGIEFKAGEKKGHAIGDCFRFFTSGVSVVVPMAPRPSPPPPAPEPKSGGSSTGKGPDAMAGGSLLPPDSRGQTPQAGAGPEVGRDAGDGAEPVKPGDAPTSVGPGGRRRRAACRLPPRRRGRRRGRLSA